MVAVRRDPEERWVLDREPSVRRESRQGEEESKAEEHCERQ